jgi:hypothetical protein
MSPPFMPPVYGSPGVNRRDGRLAGRFPHAILPMRRTKIVATIGPASSDPRVLERLLLAGVDVLRLNFSHGDHAQHLAVIKAARSMAAGVDRPLALLQDLSGPKIRTAGQDGRPVELKDGGHVITTDETVEDAGADLHHYDPCRGTSPRATRSSSTTGTWSCRWKDLHRGLPRRPRGL